MTYSADSSPAPHFISHYAWIHLGFAVKLGNSVSTSIVPVATYVNMPVLDWSSYVTILLVHFRLIRFLW